MKTISIQIDDKLHSRLAALCTHHGELSFLIRRGIKMVIEQQELKRREAENAKPTT